MRLLNHLTEGHARIASVDIFNNIIHKDCKKYLSLLGSKNPLYRGMLGINADIVMGMKETRKDRTPKMMDKRVANWLNNWLQKNGHARRDKSIICTPDDSHTGMFGTPYMIFPIGSFKYTWIETRDINFWDQPSGWTGDTVYQMYRRATNDKTSYDWDDAVDKLKQMKKPVEDYFHSDKFMEGYTNGHEFWIECDNYLFCKSHGYGWDSKTKGIYQK